MEQVAVVIGGGQTLGAFLCQGLAESGYRVAVADLNEKNAASVAEQINRQFGEERAFGFAVDATNEASVEQLAKAVDQSIYSATDTTPSRASPLPHLILSAPRTEIDRCIHLKTCCT